MKYDNMLVCMYVLLLFCCESMLENSEASRIVFLLQNSFSSILCWCLEMLLLHLITFVNAGMKMNSNRFAYTYTEIFSNASALRKRTKSDGNDLLKTYRRPGTPRIEEFVNKLFSISQNLYGNVENVYNF